MKTKPQYFGRSTPLTISAVGLLGLMVSSIPASSQQLLLANPHWNISLSDFGYSDYMLDNTPGFEGREYLCGEWAAAVGYQVAADPVTPPQWLEPHFIFPDWTNNSTFHVVTPLIQTGLNADGLPIARSVIANTQLEITLHFEMLDTIVGTPMGTQPASISGPESFIHSDRYVMKQTCTFKNISGSMISNLQFFQFLHGLVSQRGVYDNRLYAGSLSEFRYDITEWGVDAAAVGAGSSTAGLEDIIGFHASMAPSAFEVGHYGIEGNGVDDHASGKPSDGVHLSVEDNWQNAPYVARLGTDYFAPGRRWISGAQRWNLGNVPAMGSVSVDVLLTLRTGTRVVTGAGTSGGCNGGSTVPGGVDYEFQDVSGEGSCFGQYSQADETEIAVHIAQGEFDPLNFLLPSGTVQLWELAFSGVYSGAIHLTFGYDPTVLPTGFAQPNLCIYQFTGSGWQKLTSTVDPVSHTIAVTVDNLSVFALGVDTGTSATFSISTTVSPANSGGIAGGGTYAEASSVTLVANANPGYVFANWTENGPVVSSSPSYTFAAHSDRTLTANFIAVGDSRAINTSSLPPSGGTTSGDGAYAVGASATVVATPNAGYKFSKWLDNGVAVSTSSPYTFTVTTNRALVAKFKPVYTMAVSADPPAGGEVEADLFYELGELAKCKAFPNPGYSFVEWTQNGTQVSDDQIYQFNVNGNRELVAHFALGNRIDVSAEPVNAGTVTGKGVYPAGAAVSVIASANPGYVFVNWTENGAAVSTSPAYSFLSTASRTLAANFIAQPGLTFTADGGTMEISWPAAAVGWVLQESSDLSGPWANSPRSVTVVGSDKQISVSLMTGRCFFRLGRQDVEGLSVAGSKNSKKQYRAFD